MSRAARARRAAVLAATALPHRISRAEQALRHIESARPDAVTLDVFDTALLRALARPTDLFWLVGWRLRAHGWPVADLDAFAAARMRAEAEARRAAAARGEDETTLPAIHAAWRLPEAFRDAAEREEIAAERDVCTANAPMLALFGACRQRAIPVAFLSDTYLPRDAVETMLRDAGYAGAFEVFVSSAYARAKWSGRLFGVAAAALGVPGGRMLHIGDNAQADVRAARRAGWRALWYRPALRVAPAPRSAGGVGHLVSSVLAGVGRDTLEGAPDVLARIGATVAAPLFLGFGQFVAAEARRAAVDVVAFCARDGLIVQRVYDMLAAAEPALPRAVYLMVSRRALVFPAIETLGPEARAFLTAQFAPLTVVEVLGRIGLDPAACVNDIRDAGLAPTQRISTAQDRSRLDDLLTLLEPRILATVRDERALALRYLEQSGVLTGGSVAIVDVGWQGSLQRALALLAAGRPDAPTLTGWYFGTRPEIRNLPAEAGPAVGWFVDAGEPARQAELVRTQWAVLELLFTAAHGTVLSYRDENGVALPVLDDPAESRTAAYGAAAQAIQRAAMVAIGRYLRAFGTAPAPTLAPADVAPPLARLCLRPTLAEARVIGDLFHVDGLGATRTGQHIARPPQGAARFRPGPFLAGFRQASWRRAYLVRSFGGTRQAAALIAVIRLLRPRFKSA